LRRADDGRSAQAQVKGRPDDQPPLFLGALDELMCLAQSIPAFGFRAALGLGPRGDQEGLQRRRLCGAGACRRRPARSSAAHPSRPAPSAWRRCALRGGVMTALSGEGGGSITPPERARSPGRTASAPCRRCRRRIAGNVIALGEAPHLVETARRAGRIGRHYH
jgi:hypothetical protein